MNYAAAIRQCKTGLNGYFNRVRFGLNSALSTAGPETKTVIPLSRGNRIALKVLQTIDILAVPFRPYGTYLAERRREIIGRSGLKGLKDFLEKNCRLTGPLQAREIIDLNGFDKLAGTIKPAKNLCYRGMRLDYEELLNIVSHGLETFRSGLGEIKFDTAPDHVMSYAFGLDCRGRDKPRYGFIPVVLSVARSAVDQYAFSMSDALLTAHNDIKPIDLIEVFVFNAAKNRFVNIKPYLF